MPETAIPLDWLVPTALLALGLTVGSFLNVVIYRLPLMMETRWRRDCCELLEIDQEKQAERLNLATPNSHCPQCKAPIKPWHNIPVLSYLILRGKCGTCAQHIPALELPTALAVLSPARLGPHGRRLGAALVHRAGLEGECDGARRSVLMLHRAGGARELGRRAPELSVHVYTTDVRRILVGRPQWGASQHSRRAPYAKL